MLFKVVFGFLFGLAGGVFIVRWYTQKLDSNPEVLSSNIQAITSTPSITATPSTTPTQTPTIFPIPTLVLENTPTNAFVPTKKPTVTSTPTAKPTNTSTPTATITQTPHPTIQTSIPTPTQSSTALISKSSSQEINGYVDRFASQYSVDPNVLRHIAVCESGFNSLAQNGPYAGLYQFSEGSWANYRKQIGESVAPDLRFNAEESVQTAAYVISVGKSSIWPNCLP